MLQVAEEQAVRRLAHIMEINGTVDVGSTDFLYKAAHGDEYPWRNVKFTKEERELGHFPYIPYYIEEFLKRMRRAMLHVQGEPHFIDVGCGIGDKLFLARELLGIQKVSGIEYNSQTFATAQQKFGGLCTTLINGDAFDLDFSPYNLIYMYCPIERSPRMSNLFLHIARTAPVGAVIAEMLPRYFAHIQDHNIMRCIGVDSGQHRERYMHCLTGLFQKHTDPDGGDYLIELPIGRGPR